MNPTQFFDRKWCIMFLAVSGGVFVVGAVLYGSLVAFSRQVFSDMGESFDFPIGFAVVMGGHLLMSVAGGIMLFARLMRRAPLALKIVAGVLFFITYFVIVLGGFFATIPMLIVCIVWLVRHPKSLYPPDPPYPQYPQYPPYGAQPYPYNAPGQPYPPQGYYPPYGAAPGQGAYPPYPPPAQNQYPPEGPPYGN